MRLAFAGLRHAHIFALYDMALSTPGIEITGAWEEDAAACAEAKKRMNIPFYSDYEQLLSDPNVDAVAVGDWFGIRAQRVLQALQAGKRVICDKPLCTSLSELVALRRLSFDTKLRVDIMLDLRFDGAILLARDLIGKGMIGQVHSISFTAQHPLDWGKRPMWYFEEGKHGGTINDIAIHGLDAVRLMTGLSLETPYSAHCWNAFASNAPGFRDCAQFMALLTDGVGLIADVSYAAPSGVGYRLPSYWRFLIWGQGGMLQLRCGDAEILIARDGEIRRLPVPTVRNTMLPDFMKPFDPETQSAFFAAQEAALRIQKLADES